MTRRPSEGNVPSLDGATLWSAIERASDQAGLGVYVATLDTQPPQLLYVNETAARTGRAEAL